MKLFKINGVYMRVWQKNETGLERNFVKPLNICPLMY